MSNETTPPSPILSTVLDVMHEANTAVGEEVFPLGKVAAEEDNVLSLDELPETMREHVGAALERGEEPEVTKMQATFQNLKDQLETVLVQIQLPDTDRRYMTVGGLASVWPSTKDAEAFNRACLKSEIILVAETADPLQVYGLCAQLRAALEMCNAYTGEANVFIDGFSLHCNPEPTEEVPYMTVVMTYTILLPAELLPEGMPATLPANDVAPEA